MEIMIITFVKYDIRGWDDQITLFKTAINNRPSEMQALVEVHETVFTRFYLVLLRRLLLVREMYILLENLKFISPSQLRQIHHWSFDNHLPPPSN
jgi:hypothetical protein